MAGLHRLGLHKMAWERQELASLCPVRCGSNHFWRQHCSAVAEVREMGGLAAAEESGERLKTHGAGTVDGQREARIL